MAARPKIAKQRLDVLLVERELAESRQKAQAMILAGEVMVEGARCDKAGIRVPAQAAIEIKSRSSKYASRAGSKLEGALKDFEVAAAGRTCLDIGASNGGFTDCLLAHGAARVYAVDVTINQIPWRLQQDARVVQVKTNARYLRPDQIAETPGLVVADVSFISVTKVLPAVVAAASPQAEFLILVKPQFELKRGDIGRGGVVSDPALHQQAVKRVWVSAVALGLRVDGVKPSRLPGAEGNQEFFMYAVKTGELVKEPSN